MTILQKEKLQGCLDKQDCRCVDYLTVKLKHSIVPFLLLSKFCFHYIIHIQKFM